MQCPRCGANGIDAQGFCVNCRLFRGAPATTQPPVPGQPQTGNSGPQPTNGYPSAGTPQPQSGGPAQPGVPAPQPGAQPQSQPVAAPRPPTLGATGAFPAAAAPGGQPAGAYAAPSSGSPTGAFPAAYGQSTPGAGYPAAYPAPRPRNPLLIPGLIFGVVALLLVGAVIVYAATSGGDEDGLPAAAPPPATASATPSASAGPTTDATPTASVEPSASASASPSKAADAACVYGVWLEEKHDEQVTVRNTGVFPFTSSGTYQRYNDTGRAVFDYGNGVHLTGTSAAGTSKFDYMFTGFISYTFKVENGMLVFGDPRPNGTETFYRNGVSDYSGKLAARVPEPMKINCGSVAMSLTNSTITIQMKRTSSAP
ncbi:hypothetical protein KZZ52_10895 [Dactylosporangium sp. AC04546]|uniref:hypothetical protein n=1 Tax=Dactylosporangium sp. AC04546 TaxID=2862460 RepID=UPI002E7C1FC2|nr:hypothetical protein [Dactylosporangium sp. AC04546]WVK85863.1 hypothetical protein KZZ52_10895 [Dactylosporangium sp. AC04546]